MLDDLNASERQAARFFVSARAARVVLATVHHELAPYVEPEALVAVLLADYYDRAAAMDSTYGPPMLTLAGEVLLAISPDHLRFTGTLDPSGDPRAQVAQLLGPWIKPEHADEFFELVDDFLKDEFYFARKPDTMPAMLLAADHIREQLPPAWLNEHPKPRTLAVDAAAPPLPPVSSLLRALLAGPIRDDHLDELLECYADFLVTLPEGDVVAVIDLAVRIVVAVPRAQLRDGASA